MRLYIAGPMTGLPEFNFPAFNEAAKLLRDAGYQVCNPAENFAGRVDLPRAVYIRADLKALLECDGIVLLPNWRYSAGARMEHQVGVELELPAGSVGLWLSAAKVMPPLNGPPAIPSNLAADYR